ncbi:hypothetical protein ABGB18_41555 [Nonomuraea sp. B12E4]|uniref:hypothetical protein n=1 Tax=Nonomuraea sp. B12E4 TaxID=3153564 RepID=UPI00325C5AAD
MKGLNTTRRTVRFTVGWKITDTDETAIAKLPETAWQAAVRQDGEVHEHAQVAELTGLDERATLWGVRLLVRRVRPSARDAAQLTGLEKKTGWKYAIIATNRGPRGLRGIPGSHQLAVLDFAGAHQQGHGAAQPAFQDLERQRRLGADLQPRGRPRRLDPAAWPA